MRVMDSTADFFGMKPIASLRVMAGSEADVTFAIDAAFGGFP
jgi:hypothetical protein